MHKIFHETVGKEKIKLLEVTVTAISTEYTSLKSTCIKLLQFIAATADCWSENMEKL